MKKYDHLFKPKIAAFDLDETIHDIIDIYTNITNNTIEHMGKKPLSDDDFNKIHANGFVTNSRLFKEMFKDQWDAALEFYHNAFHSVDIDKKKVLPGAKFMLKQIKYKYQLKIIGVTNSEQHMAKKALRNLGLLKYFDSVTGVKGNRNLKPETDLLIIGLNKINEKCSKSVWLLGDSKSDTECARKAGCTGIRFYKGDVEPVDHNADAICNSHYDYEKMIGKSLES